MIRIDSVTPCTPSLCTDKTQHSISCVTETNTNYIHWECNLEFNLDNCQS